jgi:hypothetical protein
MDAKPPFYHPMPGRDGVCQVAFVLALRVFPLSLSGNGPMLYCQPIPYSEHL